MLAGKPIKSAASRPNMSKEADVVSSSTIAFNLYLKRKIKLEKLILMLNVQDTYIHVYFVCCKM